MEIEARRSTRQSDMQRVLYSWTGQSNLCEIQYSPLSLTDQLCSHFYSQFVSFERPICVDATKSASYTLLIMNDDDPYVLLHVLVSVAVRCPVPGQTSIPFMDFGFCTWLILHF